MLPIWCGENAWSLGFYIQHGEVGVFSGGDLDGDIEAAIQFDRFRRPASPGNVAGSSQTPAERVVQDTPKTPAQKSATPAVTPGTIEKTPSKPAAGRRISIDLIDLFTEGVAPGPEKLPIATPAATPKPPATVEMPAPQAPQAGTSRIAAQDPLVKIAQSPVTAGSSAQFLAAREPLAVQVKPAPQTTPHVHRPRISPLTGCKAGHHGSKNSNFDAFLRKNTPRFEVVSTNGSYGHPADETLQRFARAQSLTQVYVTNPLSDDRMPTCKAQFGSLIVIAGDATRNGSTTVDQKRVKGHVTLTVSPEQATRGDWSISYQRAPGVQWGGRDKRIRDVRDEYFDNMPSFTAVQQRMADANVPPPFRELLASCKDAKDLADKANNTYKRLEATNLEVQLKPIKTGTRSGGIADLDRAGSVLSYKAFNPDHTVVLEKGRVFMHKGLVMVRQQTNYRAK